MLLKKKSCKPTENNPFPIPFYKVKIEPLTLEKRYCMPDFNEMPPPPTTDHQLVSIKNEDLNETTVLAAVLADRVQCLTLEIDQLRTEKNDLLFYLVNLEQFLKEANETFASQRKEHEESTKILSSQIVKLVEALDLAKKLIENQKEVSQTELDKNLKEIRILREKNILLEKKISMQSTSGLKRVN